jgi:ABC-2 type transport system permease protein
VSARLVLTIAGREARSLAASAVAQVAAALTLAVSGLLFVSQLSSLTQARLDGWFADAAVLLLFLTPVLAMRSIAEERRSGSLDVLLAGPVSRGALVAGKFLGIFTVYVVILAGTLLAPIIVAVWGDPDAGLLLGGYLGLLLLGAASIAIALLASALSPHQAIAAVTGFVLLLTLWLLHGLSDSFAGTASHVIDRFGSTTYLPDFNRGLLRLEGVVYYVSVTTFALVATGQLLVWQRRR